MGKPVSTIGGTSTGPRISGWMMLLIVFAIALFIAVVTHGVPPVVGLPLAIAGATAVSWAFSGSRR